MLSNAEQDEMLDNDKQEWPGVASARRVQSSASQHAAKLALAQRLLEHQAPPGELKLLINLKHGQLSKRGVAETSVKLF